MNKKILTLFLSAALSLSALSSVCAYAGNEEENTPTVKGLQDPGESEKDYPSFEPLDINSDSFKNIYLKEIGQISETAEADTAACIIDAAFTSDTVTQSCTIKELTHDITVDAGDNKIILLLDNLTLDNTITVKADKGSVIIFVRGTFACGGNSKGILWHELCNGRFIDYKQNIPIIYFGEEDSVISLTDKAVLCGEYRTPFTTLVCNSKGTFSVEYIDEECNGLSDVKTITPAIIGSALFYALEYAEPFDVAYCHASDKESNIVRYGDANNDDILNMADAVAIMQSIANPDKNNLTEKGAVNADALAVQKHLLKL